MVKSERLDSAEAVERFREYLLVLVGVVGAGGALLFVWSS